MQVFWHNPEPIENEDKIIALVEAKVEAKEKELLSMMNKIYSDIVMNTGTITTGVAFFDIFKRLDIKDKVLRKSRKRRQRNEYLQRRARGRA